MSILSRANPAFVVAFLFLAPPVAVAQEPGGIPVPLAEVPGGYMFMRDFSERPDADGTNFPAGWYFSGAVNPDRWFGVVGEASGTGTQFRSLAHSSASSADARRKRTGAGV